MQEHTHTHTHFGDWFLSLLFVRVHANVANCRGHECLSPRAYNVCSEYAYKFGEYIAFYCKSVTVML